jgi:L-ascorbate metabolism protein UlaG (beta-lactamase superfamily)
MMKHTRLILPILLTAVVILIIALVSSDVSWKATNRTEPITPVGLSIPSPPIAGLEITYVANEGVLIAAGDKQVLIDGLHREYKRDYAFLPAEHREKIEGAKPPFDKVDLILVSHLHLDHFHPESVGLHLKNNPRAVLVSSQQVVDEVAKNFSDFPLIKPRVKAATPPLKEKLAMNVAGIDFDILGLGHGSASFHWIQNLGHIINLGHKKLLHLGDADISAEIFKSFKLDEEGIDIAFIPFWFLLDQEGQTIVREHIKPRQVIAVHVSPSEGEKVAKRIRRTFPDAVTFNVLLQKSRY